MTTLSNQIGNIGTHISPSLTAGAGPKGALPYVVVAGDTLMKLAVKFAGKGATHKKVLATKAAIIALNQGPTDNITKARSINVYSAGNSQPTGTVAIKRLAVVPGEQIWIQGSSA
jgi:hypothetical protein